MVESPADLSLDEVDERLELLPMAARRGSITRPTPVSRRWASLRSTRRRLVDAGAARDVDVAVVRRECEGARPSPEPAETVKDPRADCSRGPLVGARSSRPLGLRVVVVGPDRLRS